MSNSSAARALDRLTLSVRGVERDFFFRPESSDSRVIGQVFHDNCYDLERLRRFRHLVEFLARSRHSGKRPLIVDAGANIGASSLYFAMKFPDALVAAIEPEFGNHQLLVENVKGLGISTVHGAIAATNRPVRVVDVGEGFWGYQTQSVNEGEDGIRSITAQELYDMYAGECFPFITKIDIEGSEKELFSQNVEWIRQTPLLIVELHDWLLPRQGSSLPFLRCIAQLDRDFVYIGEDVYSIANDLDRLVPGLRSGYTQDGTAPEHRLMTREEDLQVSTTSPIGDVDKPLHDEVIAAMNDFKTSIAAIRNSDAELRAALNAAWAQNEELQRALATTRGALETAEQELAASRRELATTQQEFVDLQVHETVLVNELSLAINALQQLRDELDERNTMLAETRNRLESVEEELKRREANQEKKLASEAAARQELEAKLRKRSEELTAFRQRKLVRVAIKIGNWLHRRAVHSAP